LTRYAGNTIDKKTLDAFSGQHDKSPLLLGNLSSTVRTEWCSMNSVVTWLALRPFYAERAHGLTQPELCST